VVVIKITEIHAHYVRIPFEMGAPLDNMGDAQESGE